MGTRDIDEKGSTSAPDSRVIVVNVSEQVYPAVIDNHRIQKWKNLHTQTTLTPNPSTTTTTTTSIATTHNTNTGNKHNMCPRDRNTTTIISHLPHKSRTASQLSPPKHKLNDKSHMTRCA